MRGNAWRWRSLPAVVMGWHPTEAIEHRCSSSSQGGIAMRAPAPCGVDAVERREGRGGAGLCLDTAC